METGSTGREVALSWRDQYYRLDGLGCRCLLDMKRKREKSRICKSDFRSNVRAGDTILEFIIR